MGATANTLATLNTDLGAIAGLTSKVGRVSFPDSGTSLEDGIEALLEDGESALIYLSDAGDSTSSPPFYDENTMILQGQMVIKQGRATSDSLSDLYNMNDAIKAAFINSATLKKKVIRVTHSYLPDSTMSGYLWVIFKFEANIPIC